MDGPEKGALGHEPDDEGGDEFDGDGLRGWIPPADRPWRHPSEAGALTTGGSTTQWLEGVPAGRVRSGAWIVGGATCFVLILVATGLVMVAAGTAQQESSDATPRVATLTGAPTTDPGLGPMATSATIAAMVSSIRPSTVVLRVEGEGGTSTLTGLVAESGGIIVTASQSLAGARSITAEEADGTRQTAAVVGIDRPSGLAVLRIADDLPAAMFDAQDPLVGGVAVAAALEPGPHADGTPASVVYAGTVVSAGQALGADAVTTSFSATTVEAPLSRGDLGCPLLDGSGHVSGMLEMTKRTRGSTMAVFLPAQLVLGVARQLVTSGAVEHGWLGADSSDAVPTTTTTNGAVVTASAAPDGARLDSVDSNGPAAAAGLAPGDVVTAIDGNQVQSTAELRARLYPDPPGSSLSVAFRRAGTTTTTSVVLADPSTDAQGDDPSP